MKKSNALLIAFFCAVAVPALRADLVCFDGDTVTAAAFYQNWWGTSSFVDTNYLPHNGILCGKWTALPSGGGGQVVDLTWAGKNVSAMTSFSIWARGASGGENLDLWLGDASGKMTTNLRLERLFPDWHEYVFSRYEILNGADAGFDLSKLVFVMFSSLSNSRVFFDDIIIRTSGVPGLYLLGGDPVPYEASMCTCGTQHWFGSSSIVTVRSNPAYGTNSEMLTGNVLNAQLFVNNQSWAMYDISPYTNLEFWARGQSGGESLKIQIQDNGGHPSSAMTLSNLSASWTKYNFNMFYLTNGRSFNSKQMLGVVFTWFSGPNTVFIDEMRFPGTSKPSTNTMVPRLNSPANNAVVGGVPQFRWSQTPDTTRYWIEVRSNNRAGKIVASNSTVFGTNVTLPALSAGCHVWRVRAFRTSSGAWQPWSPTFTLSVNPALMPGVNLISPPDGQITNDSTPAFLWQKTVCANGVKRYDIRINNTVYDAGIPTNWTYGPGIMIDGTSNWSVRVVDTMDNIGPWSSQRTLGLDTAIPSMPLSISPADSAFINDPAPTFVWSKSTDANGIQRYEIRINDTIYDAGTSTNWTYPGSMVCGISNWRVRAVDNAGNAGTWGSVRSLTIVSHEVNAGLVLYDGDAPDTDWNIEWSWGVFSAVDATNQPRWGTKIGHLVFSNSPAGVGQTRDAGWSGLDASSADFLEMWVRAPVSVSNYVQTRLYDASANYSAPVTISVNPAFSRLSFPVSFLTNQANGCSPGFDMSKIVGIEFMDTGSPMDLWIDDLRLRGAVEVVSGKAAPSSVDNAVASNVRFTCTVKSELTNISSVTMDLTALGGAKVRMTNIGAGGTNFRYTYMVPAGISPGSRSIPVWAWDSAGNVNQTTINFTVVGCACIIPHIVYDGETPASDAAWQYIWGATNTASDVTGGLALNGTKSLQVTWSGLGGGFQVAEPSWWNGVDMSGLKMFQFYYKSTVDLALRLFSYSVIDGVRYGKTIPLSPSGGWVLVSSNVNSLATNNGFSLNKVVGAEITSAGSGTSWFDDMYFAGTVVVMRETAVPSVITNTKANLVQLWATVKTGNSSITQCRIDLGPLGAAFAGMTNVLMTNISGGTLFRRTVTVSTAISKGTYGLKVSAWDNKGNVGKGEIRLTVRGPVFLDHFRIIHPGRDDVMKWVPVWIELHQADHSLVSNWNGTITLDISKGTHAAVAWSNLSGCGSFLDWGVGSSRAAYTFNGACDGSSVMLAIKDNVAETVNIKVKSGFMTEGAGAEDLDLQFIGPMASFDLVHDGRAVRNKWESVTVRAMDCYGEVRQYFTGKVTLSVSGNAGTVRWTNQSPGAKFQNLGSGVAVCSFSNIGWMDLKIVDNTEESVFLNARSGVYTDASNSGPLRFMALDHFLISHDGTGFVNAWEPFGIRAIDALGSVVSNYSGTVTIGLSAGTASQVRLTNLSGSGTFTWLGNARAAYQWLASDAGIVSMMIRDALAETVNIRVDSSMGGATDDDAEGALSFNPMPERIRPVLSTPADGTAGLPVSTSVLCVFDGSLDPVTVNITNLWLADSGWKKVPVTFVLMNSNTAVRMTPMLPLEANEYYSVVVSTQLKSAWGGNLAQLTQWHFRTTAGPRTLHSYNTIALNGNLADWITNDPVGVSDTGSALARDDGGADTLWGHTKQLWVTWNTNNLYIALKKPIVSGFEWYDYVYIDTTRDDSGPTNGPAGWHQQKFENNRKPEFILMLDHNNIGPIWDAWTNFKWTGAAWQKSGIVASNHGQDGGGTIEIRIPWSLFGGAIPARVSLAAGVFTNRNMAAMAAYDWCPETVSGPTNWVTIDPDNDGDDVPDQLLSGDVTPPPAPSLVSPGGSAVTNDNTPVFSWASVYDMNGIQRYEIRIGSTVYDAGTSTNWTYGPGIMVDGSSNWSVRAIDNSGNPGAWSPQVSIAVDTAPPLAPSSTGPPDAGWTSDPTPALAWTASTDVNGVAGYEIMLNGMITNVGTGLSWIPGSGAVQGSNSWQIRAIDGAGNRSGWSAMNSVKIDSLGPVVTPVTPVQGYAIFAPADMIFSWTASDGVGIGTTNYYVFRLTDVNLGAVTTMTLTATAFTQSFIAGGKIWQWQVTAYDRLGNSAISAVSSFTMKNSPPAAPLWLTAVEVGGPSVSLAWENVDNETCYTLFRNVTANTASAVKIAVLSADQTNYVDAAVEPGMTYFYWVRAFNSEGASAFSPSAAITIEETGPSAYTVYPSVFEPAKHGTLKIALDPGRTVEARIYDTSGNIILIRKDVSGQNRLEWDGVTDQGYPAPSGLYVVHVMGRELDKRIKFILLR